jgi:hypothetical protein
MLFVCGIPRSGTTWAARALNAALGGSLCSEPCNWKAHPDMVQWHLRYLPATGPDEGFRALVDGVADFGYAVVKEVHTYLAIEQWARRSDQVVVVQRDPLAVAASWHELGYEVRFRIDLLLGQPRLLEDHLEPFGEHLRRSSSWFGDLGRYWGASYLVLTRIAAQHPSWQWVTHEQLCAHPAEEFARLLPGGPVDDDALLAFLREHDRPPDGDPSPYEPVRETAAEPLKWQGALSPDQAREVLAGAEPFGLLD